VEAFMTDEELGRELCPDEPGVGAKIAAAMDPLKRATYERLVTLGDEVNLWQAGLGPKPTGAIICGPRQVRRAGRF
jgi:hypothetical protein